MEVRRRNEFLGRARRDGDLEERVPNMGRHGDGTQRRARNGTRRQTHPGLPMRCTPRKSNLRYRKCQPRPSHRGLGCHVGTQAAFGRATVRILGIGTRSPMVGLDSKLV